jgi:hypothetical protein
MEQTEKKPLATKRNKDQILQLISEYEKSQGLTIKEFCKQQGIGEGSFYSFRSRYRPKSTNAKAKGFISFTAPIPQASSSMLFAEVNGIKIYQPVPADYLKALVS